MDWEDVLILRFIYKIDLRTELSSISPRLYVDLHDAAINIDKDSYKYSKADDVKALSDILFNKLEKYIVLYPYGYIKKQLIAFIEEKCRSLGEGDKENEQNINILAEYPIAYCIIFASLHGEKEILDDISRLTKIRLNNKYGVVRRKILWEYSIPIFISVAAVFISFSVPFVEKFLSNEERIERCQIINPTP